MNRFTLYWLAIVLLFVTQTRVGHCGDWSIPGNHPLTQTQAGELLISELRCAACHRDVRRDPVFEKQAPDLDNVGARVTPDFLQRFLASPSSVQAQTSMPDMLAAKSDPERKEIAESLTHFLVSQSRSALPITSEVRPDLQLGNTLYHTVGCVVCHGAIEPPTDIPTSNKVNFDDEDESTTANAGNTPRAVHHSLRHVADKYSVQSLSEFLFQPLHVRSSGRMPDMKLTPAESLAVAGYLLRDRTLNIEPLLTDPTLVTKGRKYFQELNCAACHAIEGFHANSLIGPINALDVTHGCLSNANGIGPHFQVSSAQVQSIVSAIRTPSSREPDTDEVVIAKNLTAFNCIACHIRGTYGGVHDEHNPYFTTSERNLGEDGRIPPPLTLVGAKLQPAWLKKVLFDGESVRPYMATRMPQYGVQNLKHLPELIARNDLLDGIDIELQTSERKTEKEREREKSLRSAGRELLGDKGLNCVACHNFNGKPSPINKGIDLMTSFERLQSRWFNGFVRNPGAFRPRIVMPYSWSNGIASHKTILDGNTDMQIEAIWYYLSLGTSAADPSGIRVANTRLTVGDQARTYRGRSKVAGFRGIAVGFPERIHYAFNAETGSMTALWRGDYIGVNWNGQGSGDFTPSHEPVLLGQDVSFATLTDENEGWPMLPVMTKEARRNPNPLYPKNVGYQFRGYAMDETSVPTFFYQSGSVSIEDRSSPILGAGVVQLKRVIKMKSPVQQLVWFRAMTGDIKQESDRVFRINKLRLTVPLGKWRSRPVNDEPKISELLIPISLEQGNTSMEILYELLEQ